MTTHLDILETILRTPGAKLLVSSLEDFPHTPIEHKDGHPTFMGIPVAEAHYLLPGTWVAITAEGSTIDIAEPEP